VVFDDAVRQAPLTAPAPDAAGSAQLEAATDVPRNDSLTNGAVAAPAVELALIATNNPQTSEPAVIKARRRIGALSPVADAGGISILRSNVGKTAALAMRWIIFCAGSGLFICAQNRRPLGRCNSRTISYGHAAIAPSSRTRVGAGPSGDRVGRRVRFRHVVLQRRHRGLRLRPNAFSDLGCGRHRRTLRARARTQLVGSIPVRRSHPRCWFISRRRHSSA